MKSTIIICVFLLFPALCFGGGDYVSGIVKDITSKDGKDIIHFVQTEKRPELINGCTEIEIVVQYERVPWFSWMPFVKSNHPSKKETNEALRYLKQAKNNNQVIYFGYMGNGLVSSAEKCSFKSKGLQLVSHPDIRFVLSFHDPV